MNHTIERQVNQDRTVNSIGGIGTETISTSINGTPLYNDTILSWVVRMRSSHEVVMKSLFVVEGGIYGIV